MTQIFISHSHANVDCADCIRTDLDAAGYTVWKDVQSIPPGSPSYVRAIEAGIRGSAATLVLWSAKAAVSVWVERELLYSQQLKKPIYPVLLDETPLGVLLVATQSIKSAPPCADAVAQLLPFLPALSADPELEETLLLLAHGNIKPQKDGIQKAAALISAGKYRDELLAALEDMARKSLYQGVREAAQRVVDAAQAKAAGNPDARHMIGGRCPKGHVSYFDKRRLCTEKASFPRSVVVRGDTTLSDIQVKCTTCGAAFVLPVECEEYR